MVEHTVQNHPHVSSVSFLNQGTQIFICPETGVHMIIVDGVVFMIGHGGKNGIEINAVAAQALNVIQVLRNSTDCSPVVCAAALSPFQQHFL